MEFKRGNQRVVQSFSLLDLLIFLPPFFLFVKFKNFPPLLKGLVEFFFPILLYFTIHIDGKKRKYSKSEYLKRKPSWIDDDSRTTALGEQTINRTNRRFFYIFLFLFARHSSQPGPSLAAGWARSGNSGGICQST